VSIREFTDSKGVTWRVWATYPVHVISTAEAYRGGWLTFQSGNSRRRLAPVPPSWQDASPARLELLCGNAEQVGDKGRPSSTSSRIDDYK